MSDYIVHYIPHAICILTHVLVLLRVGRWYADRLHRPTTTFKDLLGFKRKIINWHIKAVSKHQNIEFLDPRNQQANYNQVTEV